MVNQFESPSASSDPSAGGQQQTTTPRRARDLSHNPILSVGGSNLSRPASTNRLRPPSPVDAREREHALLRPAASSGEVRALEQSVTLSLDSTNEMVSAHAETLRVLGTRARAAALVEARVFELSAELSVKADSEALDRLAARTDDLVLRAKEEMHEGLASASRALGRELQSQLAELARRATDAEAALAEAARVRKLESAERAEMAERLLRLEARLEAAEASSASARVELETLRAHKAERSELAAAVAAVSDELHIALERELLTRADAKAERSALEACVERVALIATSSETRADATDAQLARTHAAAQSSLAETEARWRARTDSLELAQAEAHRLEAARAERADALERRVALRTEVEVRKLAELTGSVRAEASAALDKAEAGWAQRLEWQRAQARSELDDRVASLEREAAALASRDELAAFEREARAAISLKADAAATATGLRECARDSTVREQAGQIAEAAKMARDASAGLRAALGEGAPLQLRLAGVERELQLKCGLESVHLLLDAKPDFAQLNAALRQVDAAIGLAAGEAELSALALEVHSLAATLRAEHGVSRWLWDSGRAAGPDLRVLWDAQPTNLLPSNFSWSKSSPDVLVAAAGLYELTFGLFAACGLQVRARLLINDEEVAEAHGMHSHSPPASAWASAGEAPLSADGRTALGSSSEAAVQLLTRSSAPTSAVRRKPRKSAAQATIGEPRVSHELATLELAARLSAPPRDGPRLSGPTCVALACLLPNSRVCVRLGAGAPASLMNGYLAIRKVFNGPAA